MKTTLMIAQLLEWIMLALLERRWEVFGSRFGDDTDRRKVKDRINDVWLKYSQYCHWRETLLIDRYCLPECLNRPCLESRLTISVSKDDGTLFLQYTLILDKFTSSYLVNSSLKADIVKFPCYNKSETNY